MRRGGGARRCGSSRLALDGEALVERGSALIVEVERRKIAGVPGDAVTMTR